MHNRTLAGVALVALGIVLLADRTGVVDAGPLLAAWWPLLLVVAGGLALRARGPHDGGGRAMTAGSDSDSDSDASTGALECMPGTMRMCYDGPPEPWSNGKRVTRITRCDPRQPLRRSGGHRASRAALPAASSASAGRSPASAPRRPRRS